MKIVHQKTPVLGAAHFAALNPDITLPSIPSAFVSFRGRRNTKAAQEQSRGAVFSIHSALFIHRMALPNDIALEN